MNRVGRDLASINLLLILTLFMVGFGGFKIIKKDSKIS